MQRYKTLSAEHYKTQVHFTKPLLSDKQWLTWGGGGETEGLDQARGEKGGGGKTSNIKK
jgi:hypothetical protein